MHRELILGGPGCGKTTKLLEIVGGHLANGIRPSEMAFVAFTRKAAGEAKSRAGSQFGLSEKELPYFRTLHSFAFKELGFGSDRLMTAEHYDELGKILKLDFGKVDDEFGMMTEQKERGSQYYYIEQQSRLRCVDLKRMCLLDGRQGYWNLKHYQDSLIAFKKAKNIYDYTDILELWLDKMHPLPVKVLIVDEAQDLSPLQWRLVQKLQSDIPYVYFAGDDDQAIYEWAGADINHFLNLGVQTTVLPLSHRLPRRIFAKCDKIVKKIRHRYAKDWEPSPREGEVSMIASPELASMSTGTWMVLARNHYQLDGMAGFLKSRGYAFNFSGRSSLASQDALAVRAWIRSQAQDYVLLADIKRILPKFYKSKFKGDRSSILSQQDESTIPKSELLSLYGIDLNESWEANLILRPDERSYLKTLINRGVDIEKEPPIKISTIHAVKCGESDNVLVIPDMSAACYDSFIRKPDSEARVFYVACSRAKERLVICHPQTPTYFPL
jgi:DNA helicase-2/ATP-dependent DNA helicase PcrA